MDDKLTGSFYTPLSLIEYMILYIQNRMNPRNVLEPSAGDGRFVNLLKKFNCPITLIELEDDKANTLKAHYGSDCDIYCDDFISYVMSNDERFDLVIGNPPYISKKVLSVEQRDISAKILEYYNLPNDLFQNIWVSFILASLKVLSPNGAIFFVLPFEFLQVQYAEKLREFLETKFNTIEITTFEDKVFIDIEQDVCLVYLSNEPEAKPYIKYTTLISGSNAQQTFQSVIMRNKPLKKWSNCILNDNETEELKRIAKIFSPISTFGEISPGIVTGANAFFIVTKEKMSSFSMHPLPSLPVITKGSAIPALLNFESNDFNTLANLNTRSYLINLNGIQEDTFSQQLNNYLEQGKTNGINDRYKCKKRKRWHDVPIIKNGEACFFKRFHQMPRVIINSAGVHTTDIIYNIRFKPEYEAASFSFCFYNSLTLALCEYNGRFYGGGVGELVPNEFKTLSLPYRHISNECIQHLDELFRNNSKPSDIIDYVDSIVLNKLPKESIRLLQNIRTRYIVRRMKLYNRKGDESAE